MTVLPRELRPLTRRVPPREISHDDLQLLRLLATGLPVDSVARRLDLSERTVRRRTRTVCDRLGFGTVGTSNGKAAIKLNSITRELEDFQ